MNKVSTSWTILFSGIFIYIGIIYLYFKPSIEFINEKINIQFSILFSVIFILFFILQIKLSRRISNIFIKGITNLIYIINIIFLLGYIPISHFRIDPPTQFYDKEILFTKTDNPNEKIIKQYTKSWKTGRKDFETINHVQDFGIIRIFKNYNVTADAYQTNKTIWTNSNK